MTPIGRRRAVTFAPPFRLLQVDYSACRAEPDRRAAVQERGAGRVSDRGAGRERVAARAGADIGSPRGDRPATRRSRRRHRNPGIATRRTLSGDSFAARRSRRAGRIGIAARGPDHHTEIGPRRSDRPGNAARGSQREIAGSVRRHARQLSAVRRGACLRSSRARRPRARAPRHRRRWAAERTQRERTQRARRARAGFLR